MAELLAQVGEEGGVVEDVRHARPDAELEVAHFDADLLERADAADVEDAKIGHLEPFLAVMPRGILKRIEEIDAQLGR